MIKCRFLIFTRKISKAVHNPFEMSLALFHDDDEMPFSKFLIEERSAAQFVAS